MYFREIGWGGIDWINLAKNRDSGGLLWSWLWTFGFHKMARKFLSSCTIGGFSRRAQLHEVRLV
jgi:hypothetical protein